MKKKFEEAEKGMVSADDWPHGICDESCPGWFINEETFGIERCDECCHSAGRTDLTDDDAAKIPAARFQQNMAIRCQITPFLSAGAARAFYDELPPLRLSAQAMKVIKFLEHLIVGDVLLSEDEIMVLNGIRTAPKHAFCAPRNAIDRLLRLGLIKRTTKVGKRHRYCLTDRGDLELNVRNLK